MKAILIMLLAACFVADAQPPTTTISDCVYAPSGGPWSGRMVIEINNPGNAQPLIAGGSALAAKDLIVEVVSCSLTATLVPNTEISPSGTSYKARYFPSGASAGWVETWVVGSSHTTLSQIRSSAIPTPIAMFAASRITQSGASSGQVLAWDGSQWSPTTAGAGSTYTASAAIDVGAVVDGACRLDSTAVTVTGAALGGRPTLGMSYQPPEGVVVAAKVTGPNSMKVEICNWSGASYDPASATYYFGVTQ